MTGSATSARTSQLTEDMAERKAAGLACWRGRVRLEPLGGGISNTNFVAEDAGERFVVRIGDDVPEHGVVRDLERNASRAAHAAGLAPELVHAEPGALVFRYIEGRTLTPADVRDPAMLARILELVRTCHLELPRHLCEPTQVFSPFRAVRDYAARLEAEGSRLAGALPRLVAAAERLEAGLGRGPLVFAHNDLLAANLIDDGARLWLIDWEYGGFNAALFDLGNVASNNDLGALEERRMLEAYFGGVDAGLERRYAAAKAISLLREALWSLVSERHSGLDFDYAAYTGANLRRFERAYARFLEH